MIQNDEESQILLQTNLDLKEEENKKNESKEEEPPIFVKKYDLGSKFKNIQNALGDSLIHWFIPLDWPQYEMEKRMFGYNISCDLGPCTKRRSFIGNKQSAINTH
eukprot:118546_1